MHGTYNVCIRLVKMAQLPLGQEVIDHMNTWVVASMAPKGAMR